MSASDSDYPDFKSFLLLKNRDFFTFDEKDLCKKEPFHKRKEENYLPFTTHLDFFITPSHYIIKKEAHLIFQTIEKAVIELEKRIKNSFIEGLLREMRLNHQKELKNVIKALFSIIKGFFIVSKAIRGF